MGLFIVIVAIAIAGYFLLIKPDMVEIHKCNNARDVVMSLNHGRVYPYYTGMNLDQVKSIVRKSFSNTTEFDNSLSMQKLMGCVHGVAIPQSSNALINEIYIHINNEVVTSISIGISKLNFLTLVEQMTLKFGNPVSFDKQFMRWRDSYMVITLDSINKRINVMDERLCQVYNI